MTHPSYSSSPSTWLAPDTIRGLFSQAMSEMYRAEVPLYGDLVELVSDVNQGTLQTQDALRTQLQERGELDRLDVERHGAIRLGTAQELSTLRSVFAVMGMEAVGYYDLSAAGVPVHSTAFRPVRSAALHRNPFRVFTSLLRLDLIADPALRSQAQAVLEQRDIFSPRLHALLALHAAQTGLNAEQASEFVREVLETFRWHSEATVDLATYRALSSAHPLIADVVCFKGPHINHLTPRTLDIDAAAARMADSGMEVKDSIEGPPPRRCPILLRQTSFKALREPVRFAGEAGSHMARFGEIEQRGAALTAQGRALYDALLRKARSAPTPQHSAGASAGPASYAERLAQAFAEFPDDWESLRRQGLAYFEYHLTPAGAGQPAPVAGTLNEWIAHGWVQAVPVVYEDFLPVSAAGIFQSNLGAQSQQHCAAQQDRDAFERDLGAAVHDEFALYAAQEQASLAALQDWASNAAPPTARTR